MTPPANGMNAQKIRQIAVAIAVTAFTVGMSAPSFAQKPFRYAPGELIVGMKPGFAHGAIAIESTLGKVAKTIPQIGVVRIKTAQGVSVEETAKTLRARPDVAYVEYNGIYHTCATPNDPGYYYQYAPGITQADIAWESWKPKAQIVVAVVDTGIDYTHPDLTNKILRVNGAVYGYNTVGSNDRSGDPTDPIDDQGHGTHCAGIVAAQSNNGVGVAGIAGWNGSAGSSDTSYIKLMPVKVLSGTGSGTDVTVSEGIVWAADHGAKVISLSLGGGGSTTQQNAVAYAWSKGCVIVAAAGNDAVSDYSYPAAYPNVISVASTDNTDTLSDFSNFGSWVTCAAPGGSIYSTLPTYDVGRGVTSYGTMSGTSMATPLVAGEAALLLSHNPSLTNSQIFSLITQNVDEYYAYYWGGEIAPNAGRVNVFQALKAADPQPLGTPIVDFNGDGKWDCVAFNSTTGQIAIMLMDGTKIFNSYSLSPALPKGWLVGGTADFLRNGTTSLAVQNLATQQISILGINGNKVVSSTPLSPPMLPNWKIRCSGDFDGDGQPDLIAQNTVTRDISIITVRNLKITGSIPVRPTLPAGWVVSGAADMDGNGSTDILVQNSSTQQVAALYMSGTSLSASASITPNLPSGWTAVGFSDVDRDGKADLLVQKMATRQISALVMTGTKFTNSIPVSPAMAAGWELVGPK